MASEASFANLGTLMQTYSPRILCVRGICEGVQFVSAEVTQYKKMKYFQIGDLLFDLFGKLHGLSDKEPNHKPGSKIRGIKGFFNCKILLTFKTQEKMENNS